MPDSPLPLQIRDWKTVARDYDSIVFSTTKTGLYLPLSRLGIQGQFNYSDNTPLFMDSYVGALDHLDQAEAINIIPAIVGATLAGIDKSNQDGINYVAMTKDFFNLRNGQNVYLNGYSSNSGDDWWYDVMPNVYFFQLNSLYPDETPEFQAQFISVADRWLYCVTNSGGKTTPWTVPNMNYRAFNFSTGIPLKSSVPEPESAGSIAWLLYNAYHETGNRKYLEGAQLAMDFLAGFTSNPAYELQLPYGIIAAARMNAVEGTNYPLQKMLDWSFNRGALRGWGSIVGTWGGYDVSGLIGEANNGGDDYAFVMNGFQQVAALAPLAKYDKRYAKAIGKWILNVTNASRLFYWNALPPENQDSYEWASVYDPSACIPYESMKESYSGKTPLATGDAKRGGWAYTNLSLYSGSSVGYLAGVVKTTNIPDILRIDLNKTDFYGDNRLISWLYYNPGNSPKNVDVILPAGTYNIYEAITETTLFNSVSGIIELPVPSGEVRILKLYPAGINPVSTGRRLYAGNEILDYNFMYGYPAFLRIKSLSVNENIVEMNSYFEAWCEPGNINPSVTVHYQWFINNILVPGQTQSRALLQAPGLKEDIIIKCKITANSQFAEDTLKIKVVDHIPVPPVVNGIQGDAKYTVTGGSCSFTAQISPVEGETLQYFWSCTNGILSYSTGATVSWHAPATASVEILSLKVTNQDGLSSLVSSEILVKDTSIAQQSPIIHYPFDTDNLNAVSDQFHAFVVGPLKTNDARAIPLLAWRFSNGSDIIYTENTADLNFANEVSLSCWVKCELLGSERFIISHGSWQQRYKLSITPEGFIRWTVKTSSGVTDLDGSFPIMLNQFYHITVLYTGFSMELYVNGELDTFKAFSGSILPSTKPITFGRMDDVETQYALRGSVDEVKIWNQEIPPSQIEKLMHLWTTASGISYLKPDFQIFPNPTKDNIYIESAVGADIEKISVFTVEGIEINKNIVLRSNSLLQLSFPNTLPGLYLIKITMPNGTEVYRKFINQ
jgi:hypothetical protein